MQILPKEYREFSEKITEILRSKPKKGYFESMVESGKLEPLDAIEEVSAAIGGGNKISAVQILQTAQQDENKRELLSYIDDLDEKLQQLIEEIRALPEIDSSQTKETQGSNMMPIMAVGIVLIVVVMILVFNFL